MSTFESSILQVLRGDSVVGAAFLVSDRLVATCAHVVESSGAQIGGKISLRSSENMHMEAVVEPGFWRDPNAEDVSILRLREPVEHMQPLLLGASSGTKGHDFSTFGFPQKGQELTGGGKIIGQAIIHGIKVLQLRSPEVTPGFSGGPVLDEMTGRIVGIVVAITPPDEYQRLGTTAFAIPSETIREVCPEVELSDICPYRSLDVFNEQDAPFFFGRERVVQKMLDSLKREPRFLAVLGPSGSGKSSVVRAGLIPALKQGKVPGSDRWGVMTIRPATQPFEQLDAAGLPTSQAGVEHAIHAWLENNSEKARLVLVIDQFEEVLVSTPEDIRHRFVNELARVLNASAAVTIGLTLRDDFYSRFLQDAPMLTTWIERGLVNIPPMLEKDELRAIVMEPARQVGLGFEEGLVDVILASAAEADRTTGTARSTILPLLEFALTQVWERRQEGKLTHDAYHAIGGVAGSLTQWADRAYHNLTLQEREIARHILSDLVRPGNEEQGVPDTRHVRTVTGLAREDEAASRRIIDQLVTVRLLSTWRDEESGSEKVEIIHDALLREWGLLRGWISENRSFLTWREGLELQIRKWEENKKEDVALLHGLPLIEAEGWLATHKEGISKMGQQFIEAGLEFQERERLDKEKLYQMTVRQVEHLEALREIDLAISSTFDSRLVVQILLEKLVRQLAVDAVDLLLFNVSTRRLEYTAGLGFHTPGIERSNLSLGQDFAGRAALESRLVHVENLMEAGETFSRRQLLEQEGFVSYFGIPLLSKGQVNGVLEIFHRSALDPDPEWLNFLETLAAQAAIAVENALLFEGNQRANQQLTQAYDTTLEGWARALELRDRETEGHTRRVTELTLRLARYLGVKDSEMVHIYRGALLHDIGNMGVPDAILRKPGSLTAPEWDVIRMHPVYAYNLLAPISYLRSALDIPYCHHERWDGSGYPRQLKGEEIPLAARIFAIADTFDRLVSDRPYRPGWPTKPALSYIQEQAGKQFDPQIVKAFLRMVTEEA